MLKGSERERERERERDRETERQRDRERQRETDRYASAVAQGILAVHKKMPNGMLDNLTAKF